MKAKTHHEKRERERERERKRERDFAPSFPVTAGPPGRKYTVTGTCASRDGRAPPGVCDSSQSHRPLGSPACRPFKGTCATEFGPVNTGLAKERALAWRSLSPKSLVEKVAPHGARSTSRISRAQRSPLSQHGGLPVANGQRGTLNCASVVSHTA